MKHANKEYRKYVESIKKSLSEYKKEKFPTLQDGYWRGKGGYRHILPRSCGVLNLLETYRDVFLKDDLSTIRFHQFFHHLNSSQAMCINFFFPLFFNRKLDIILDEWGLTESILYDKAESEKESSIDNINAIQEKTPELQQNDTIPTSFDFYFETAKKKFYFEIKYTEQRFGPAKKDKNTKKYLDKYKLKYERIYKGAANGKIQQKYDNEKSFLGHYQIMRNLIHVDNDSYVIFVVPEGNEPVYKQAKRAKEDFVVEKYKENVKVITWDELYDVIAKHEHGFSEPLKTHFEEFKQKYKLKI